MNTHTIAAAEHLRSLIEDGTDPDARRAAALDFVAALGGNTHLFNELVITGKHVLALTYLITLVLAQS